MFRSQARKDMKRTITYSAVVAFSLSLCSLGLSGCGDAADSEPATEPAPTTTDDGSSDKGDDGSSDKDADAAADTSTDEDGS